MFKKILNFFVEDEENEEEKQVVYNNVVTNKKQVIYKKPPEVNVVKDVQEIVKEKPKRIEIEDLEVKTIVTNVKKNTPKPTPKPLINADKYVFTPPISPIFGVIGNEVDKKDSKAKTQANYVKKPSQIGTIISPIYGRDEDNEIENVINNVVESKEVSSTQYDDTIKQHNYSIDELLKSSLEEVNQDKGSNDVIDNITLFDEE